MNELSKIKKVMHKVVPGSPDEVLFVDGSTDRMLSSKQNNLQHLLMFLLWRLQLDEPQKVE